MMSWPPTQCWLHYSATSIVWAASSKAVVFYCPSYFCLDRMHLMQIINICFLIAFASTIVELKQNALKQNATFEVIQELHGLISFKISSNTTIAENTTKDQEALYSDIAASLNITESDNGRSDFVRALDVITDSYFKACYAPDCKKLTPTDGH